MYLCSRSGRSGRVVECIGLENRRGRKSIGGSNPSSSASTIKATHRAAFCVSNALIQYLIKGG
jgi:hypothetical protein